jgi:hypothetical protein
MPDGTRQTLALSVWCQSPSVPPLSRFDSTTPSHITVIDLDGKLPVSRRLWDERAEFDTCRDEWLDIIVSPKFHCMVSTRPLWRLKLLSATAQGGVFRA